jgi:hypothetical protein
MRQLSPLCAFRPDSATVDVACAAILEKTSSAGSGGTKAKGVALPLPFIDLLVGRLDELSRSGEGVLDVARDAVPFLLMPKRDCVTTSVSSPMSSSSSDRYTDSTSGMSSCISISSSPSSSPTGSATLLSNLCFEEVRVRSKSS